MLPFPSSIIVKSVTLSDDAVHHLSTEDVPFYACDFQCQTKALKIGTGGNINFILYPNETYWTYNANLRDFVFMNETAGQDTTIVIIATVPNKYVDTALSTGFRRF